MNGMVLLVLLVIALVAVAAVVLGNAGSRGRMPDRPVVGAPTARPEVESAEAYKNHLAMARWIELQLKDDLVRTSVEEAEQERARRLLAEFYGDER